MKRGVINVNVIYVGMGVLALIGILLILLYALCNVPAAARPVATGCPFLAYIIVQIMPAEPLSSS